MLFEDFRRFRIDAVSLPNHAAERRLDMAARAAEAVVEIEMPERRIEVVAPEQVDDAAAEPDAFRIAGRARWSPWPCRRAPRLSWRCPWPGFPIAWPCRRLSDRRFARTRSTAPKIKAATRAEAAERRNTRSLIGVWPSRVSARMLGLIKVGGLKPVTGIGDEPFRLSARLSKAVYPSKSVTNAASDSGAEIAKVQYFVQCKNSICLRRRAWHRPLRQRQRATTVPPPHD